MRRWDLWKRLLPANIFFNIIDRVISTYYSNRIEEEGKSMVAAGMDVENPTQEQAYEYMDMVYSNLWPMVGLLLLSLLLFVYITSPWQVKRLHDIGMSGKWYLVWLIPSLLAIPFVLISPILPDGATILPYLITVPAAIFLLICNIIDSQYAANRYGESPKYRLLNPTIQLPESCKK